MKFDIPVRAEDGTIKSTLTATDGIWPQLPCGYWPCLRLWRESTRYRRTPANPSV